MKIENIKNYIKKLIDTEKNKFYESVFSDERNKINETFNIYNKYYLKLLNNSSFSSAYIIKEDILKEAEDYEQKYNEAYNQYQKLKSVSEKNKLSVNINSYVNRINALNTLYNIFDKELELKDDNLLVDSNRIVKYIMMFDSENNIEEKNRLQAKIYELKDERRAKFNSRYSDNLLEKINTLESLEYRIARTPALDAEPYKLDKKKYISALKETIKAINDYYYLEYKNSTFFKKKDKNDYSKLDTYIRKYHALITSLFKERYHMIEIDDNKISTDDLLNYLSVFNLEYNYEVFIAKNRNNLIGNQKVNKDYYNQNISLLNSYVNKLIEDCSFKIRGKTIDIVSDNELKNQLINDRKSVICEIEEFSEGNRYGGRYEYRKSS